MVRIQAGSELEEVAVHPYISLLLAEHRTADMLADAEVRRRVRAAVADRRSARRAARHLPPSRLGPPAEHIMAAELSGPRGRLVRTAAGPDSHSGEQESQLCNAASR
jgi:hypothetical protein